MGPAHCPLLYSKAWIHSSTVTVSWGKSSVTQFPQTNKSPKFTALLTSVFHILKCLQNGVNIITFLHMNNLHNEEIMVEWLKCSLPWWFSGKESTYSEGDSGSTPGLGRSPGVGNGNSLQYSCIKNPTEEPGGLQSKGSRRVRYERDGAYMHNLSAEFTITVKARSFLWEPSDWLLNPGSIYLHHLLKS